MTAKQSIFGSGSEKGLFQAINSRWGDRFRIYPSLPFASIIDITRLINLSSSEREFLLKTSVDFTLCTRKQARPLLSIDFDGMCHGFSQNGRYLPMQPSNDPYRELKLDLKVRKATEVGYPLFVVSYDERVPIGRNTHMTVVDGIIGLILARKQLDYNISELERSFAEQADPEQTHMNWDQAQDAVITAEYDARFKWNPITRTQAELNYRAWAKGVVKRYGTEFLTDPPLPDFPPGTSFLDEAWTDTVMRRVKAMEKVHRQGCKAVVHTSFGDVTEIAWIRNIEHAGIGVHLLVEEIALLLAFKRALALSKSGDEDDGLRLSDPV